MLMKTTHKLLLKSSLSRKTKVYGKILHTLIFFLDDFFGGWGGEIAGIQYPCLSVTALYNLRELE